MPELPEVETVRKILLTIVKGKTIQKIVVLRAKNIISGAEDFVASLTGETFLDVTRKGKYLIFHLTHEPRFFWRASYEDKRSEASLWHLSRRKGNRRDSLFLWRRHNGDKRKRPWSLRYRNKVRITSRF